MSSCSLESTTRNRATSRTESIQSRNLPRKNGYEVASKNVVRDLSWANARLDGFRLAVITVAVVAAPTSIPIAKNAITDLVGNFDISYFM